MLCLFPLSKGCSCIYWHLYASQCFWSRQQPVPTTGCRSFSYPSPLVCKWNVTFCWRVHIHLIKQSQSRRIFPSPYLQAPNYFSSFTLQYKGTKYTFYKSVVILSCTLPHHEPPSPPRKKKIQEAQPTVWPEWMRSPSPQVSLWQASERSLE